MADDLKDLLAFKDLQRRFTQLANKIKEKPAEEKEKIWIGASKIVIGVFDEIYLNEDADYFYDEEEEMKIFQAKDASQNVEALKEYLDEKHLSLEDGKKVVKEMINSLDPNMTGGKSSKSYTSKRKRRTHRRHHKKRKHTRKRKY